MAIEKHQGAQNTEVAQIDVGDGRVALPGVTGMRTVIRRVRGAARGHFANGIADINFGIAYKLFGADDGDRRGGGIAGNGDA